jgi:hypothetical protein
MRFIVLLPWVGVQKTFLKIKRTCLQQFQHLKSLGNTVKLVMTATTQNHQISQNLVILGYQRPRESAFFSLLMTSEHDLACLFFFRA